jgi:thymidylate kinase
VLIILEGPDGAGKTHLAERLISRIQAAQPGAPDVEYIHKKRPTEETFLAEYLDPIADYTPRSGRTLILDRWHIGELIYPEMCNRQTLATFSEFRYLEMFLRSRGALVVHVDSDVRQILEGLDQRAERDPLEERILEQHAEFSRALEVTNLRTITYQRSQDTGSDTSLDLIIAYAAAVEIDTPRLDLNPTYVGPVRPNVVLVGDKRNIRKGTFEYPTAFVPQPATSGLFLMDALPKHWLRHGLVGFINANEGHPVDIFSSPIDLDVKHSAPKPNWVVLGREAEKTLRNTGELPYFGVVPHPQYIRRFHHHARDQYGMQIQRVFTNQEDHGTWRP